MCGRFFLDEKFDAIIKKYGVKYRAFPLNPSPGEVTPGLPALVVRKVKGVPAADSMVWGLFSKEGSMIINAREESRRNPFFEDSFLHRRVIIPAGGYYEWQTLPGGIKNKFFITLENEALISLGGIYQKTALPNGGFREGFVIITTESFGDLQGIHGRMPVVVNGWEEEFLKGGTPEDLHGRITVTKKSYKFLKNSPCIQSSFIV